MNICNIHNVNWSSKTWFTCSLYFDSSVWFFWYGFFGFKSIYLRPGISHISFAFICIALSRSIVSIRICSFVSSALQLFASTASAECLCPTVFGCARFITGHVVTPSSFVHACVLVSGVVICHVPLARRTYQFWYLSSIWIYVLSLSLSLISLVFSFFVENVSCTCIWKSDFNFCHRLTWSKSYIFLHSKIGLSFLSK